MLKSHESIQTANTAKDQATNWGTSSISAQATVFLSPRFWDGATVWSPDVPLGVPPFSSPCSFLCSSCHPCVSTANTMARQPSAKREDRPEGWSQVQRHTAARAESTSREVSGRLCRSSHLPCMCLPGRRAFIDTGTYPDTYCGAALTPLQPEIQSLSPSGGTWL